MKRQTMLAAAGLLAGLLGAALVLSYVRGVERKAATGAEGIRTFVATRDIAAGTPASETAKLVEPATVPRRYAPPGAISDLRSVDGQFLAQRVGKGETLTAAHFAAFGATRGRLPIPKGKEAIAVGVPLDSGVAQYAMPGDHVSVYGTFKRGTNVTTLIVGDVEVLATRANPSNAAERVAGTPAAQASQLVFVLAVTPEEAVRVVAAKESGSIWLTLVPQGQRSKEIPVFSGDFTAQVRCTGDERSIDCRFTGRGR